MSKILLFDFDGTLANSYENFLYIVHELSLKYKLPLLSREELENLRSEDARTLVKRLKIPFYLLPFLGRDMKQLQAQAISEIKPYTGLPEALHELRSLGYTLGVLTSNARDNVTAFITSNNIDIFDYIYSDSSIFGKDKVLRKFLNERSVTKEDVLYIGDEIRDIQACQKVGIKIASVTWGFNSKSGLLNHHPDYCVDSPQALVELVHRAF